MPLEKELTLLYFGFACIPAANFLEGMVKRYLYGAVALSLFAFGCNDEALLNGSSGRDGSDTQVALSDYDTASGTIFIHGTDMGVGSVGVKTAARSASYGGSPVYWTSGRIPYAFTAAYLQSSDPVIKSIISSARSAALKWNAASSGKVELYEVAESYAGKKIVIGAWDCASGYPACADIPRYSTGSILRLMISQAQGVGESTVIHEFGHLLGLMHEQDHPRFCDYAARIDGAPATCQEMLNTFQSAAKGTSPYLVELGDPDFASIMMYPNSVLKNKFTGKPITGSVSISAQDGASVALLFGSPLLYSYGSIWPKDKKITLSYGKDTDIPSANGNTAGLNYFLVQGAARRWVSNIDPSQNLIGFRGWTVDNSYSTTADVRIRVVTGATMKSYSGSSETPYLVFEDAPGKKLGLVLAKNAGVDTNLVVDHWQKGIYQSNILQAVVGEFLGVAGANKPGRAGYMKNNWGARYIFPSDEDVAILQSAYHCCPKRFRIDLTRRDSSEDSPFFSGFWQN